MKILQSLLFATFCTTVALVVVTALGIALSYIYGADIKTESDLDWFVLRMGLGLIHVGAIVGLHSLVNVFFSSYEIYYNSKSN